MTDPNYEHEFMPNRNGKCQRIAWWALRRARELRGSHPLDRASSASQNLGGTGGALRAEG